MTRRIQSRRGVTVLGLIAVVVAILGGVAAAASGGGAGGSSGRRPLIITAEAQRRTLKDSITVKGTVGRVEQREIQASSAAQVTDVPIAGGAEVAAGSPLLSLDGRAAIAENGDLPFFRSLDVGDRGEDVRQLETILRAEGYQPGRVDDAYTEATRSALAQWQAARRYPGATPERPETVTVSLRPSNGYTVGDRSSAGVTIQPAGVTAASAGDDVTEFHASATANPTLSIRAVAAVAAEGMTATFRIDADDVPTGDKEITVSIGGTVGDDDVLAPAGTITLAQGAWSTTVSIPIRQDSKVEADESLKVRVVDGAGYDVDPAAGEATTTVLDDDVPKVTISGGQRVAEGAVDTIKITADQAPEKDVQIGLTVAGDAVPGRDYRAIDPFVVLPGGKTAVEVPITTLADDTLEDDERIVVAIAANALRYALGPEAATVVTIAQAAGSAALPVVRLRATATSVKEGTPFPLTVTLDRPLTQDLVLQLAYAGDAREGDDFTPLGRVAVPAGTTSLPLQVPTVQDDRVETDRTLLVTVLPSASYLLGAPSAASATIESDDLPELTLVSGRSLLGEGGGTTFRIVADQAPTEDISIDYQAVGSATSGQDYDALTGTAVLKAGQTSLEVPLLTIADDVTFEPTDMITGRWPIRVGQVLVEEGDSVAPGAPLLSLTDSRLTVTLRASASDRTRLKTGQKVTVTVTGSTDEAEGVITKLDETAQVDEKTKEQFYEGTVEVRDLDAADGANVSIEVILEQQDRAVTVPIAAVKQNGDGADVVRVLDLERRGSTREVRVKTGISEGSYIEIESGLDGGEVVIVEVDEDK